MLYYLLFWTILGFIFHFYIISFLFFFLFCIILFFFFHFYIIFGTNLLTGDPAQNCCFFAYFSVSKKRNIKRSPIDLKLHGTYFWTRRSPRSTRAAPGESRAAHEGGGCAPLPRGQPGGPP